MSSRSTSLGEPLARFGVARSGFTARPVITGRHGVAAAGHYLAAEAGMAMLHGGGNAIDAGVAMGFCLAVLEPYLTGLGGEVPILIHHARSGKTVAISGQGVAPRAATISWFIGQGINLIPGDGLLPATVPAQVATFLKALADFGTLPVEAVLRPALELARDGFAMYHGLRASIQGCARRFREEWPTSAEVYLPGGKVPEWGDHFCNPPTADVLQRMVRAAQRSAGRRTRTGGRLKAIRAALGVFYDGFVAQRIADFCRKQAFVDATGKAHHGLLTRQDMASYSAKVEEPVHLSYHGLEVYKCGPWTQGPVFLQQLALLEGFDLGTMGHNSVPYIHTVTECAKLAFADREFYYGDPDFVDVPLDRLLSKPYAARRRRLVNQRRASLLLRPGNAGPRPLKLILGDERSYQGDTTHLCCIDAQGNMIAATPSGGWIPSSPVVPGLGFPLGTRAQIFSLDPAHPNCLQPGKRPRTTLTPSLVLRRGRPYMVFGTPGGDAQDQWTLQFFLNLVHFGMSVQEALEAPLFYSAHFPSSFYPRAQHPGQLIIEGRVPRAIRDGLKARGHDVVDTGDWSCGRVLAVRRDEERQLIFGGASPRGETGYAIGW